ncbi:MAG: response regulator, partial [bacterium]
MYNILIVDDEKIAIRGIRCAIKCSKIADIYEAYGVNMAREIFEENEIDILICDIEMPGDNGLKLIEWVGKEYPETVNILLTGHASFDYAQQAIKMDVFEYLLKPVQHEELNLIIEKAVNQIEENKSLQDFYQVYEKYSSLWQKQRPLLVERFWQDLLSDRIRFDLNLEKTLQIYNIPLSSESHIIPILISVEEWQKQLDARDEEIMQFALRNVA